MTMFRITKSVFTQTAVFLKRPRSGAATRLRISNVPLILFAIAAILQSSVAHGGDHEDLVEKWKGQHAEIATAHLECQYAVVSTGTVKPLKSDEVSEILQSLHQEYPQMSPVEFKQRISSALLREEKAASAWREGFYVYSAEGSSKFETRLNGALERSRVFAHGCEIVADARNKQVSLVPLGSSKSYAFSLREFRHVPRLTGDGLKDCDSSLDGDSLTFSRKGREILQVSKSTGLVAFSRNVGAGGDILQERRQYGAKRYHSDLRFPEVSVHARYDGDELYLLSIFIEQAYRFNEPLPPNAFVVPAFEHGVNVFDYRAKQHGKPTFFRAERDVEDIVKAADAVASTRLE